MSDPLISVNSLTPHPRNHEFFDEPTGQSWEDFLQSVRTSDVREPIVIDQNNMIISGHMRVRACKELGIPKIKYTRVIYDSDDQRLKDLIELNIKQRGIGNPNPVKFGRCIKELERIYGIQHGGDRKSDGFRESKPNISVLKTQSDFATQLGISADTLRNYKQLAESIPEIQKLLECGIVTATTAQAIIKKLPEEQQRKLAEQLISKDEKATGSEVNKLISELKEKDKRIKELEDKNNELTSDLNNNAEVIPDDYENLKESCEELVTKNMLLNQEIDQLKLEHQKALEIERAKSDESALEIERLRLNQYSGIGREIDVACDFTRDAKNFINKYYTELLANDYFDRNQDNSCEREILEGCELLRNFIDDVVKACRLPAVIDVVA